MSKLLEKYKGKAFVYQWAYRDSDRKIIGYTRRYENEAEEKSIIPFFKREDGNWCAGIDLKPRPLFGLDKLAKCSTDEIVIIAEGEKSAVAYQNLGFCAVTSIGGANAANKSDWSPLIGFSNVVISPDNDKAGEQYARDVFAELRKLSPESDTLIIRLPNLPVAGDIVDYIQKFIPDWDGYSRFEADTELIQKKIRKHLQNAKSVPEDWISGSTGGF
jgi:hypothetical protein